MKDDRIDDSRLPHEEPCHDAANSAAKPEKAEEKTDKKTSTGTQAEVLLKLAENASLFHSPDGTGYADVKVNGHRETWPIRSRGFRRWLDQRFYSETSKAPSSC